MEEKMMWRGLDARSYGHFEEGIEAMVFRNLEYGR
jgi:hypothetical protein